MKPVVNIAICALLVVIASLLAWPYVVPKVDIRNTAEYKSDVTYCDMKRIMGQLKGDYFAGSKCDEQVRQKYGL